jgi:hypothetical protein
MARYNTNLAAEFHVLSVLYRLGADANLTLGNKKVVDIMVARDAGDSLTIDVKGLAGTSSWPVDNIKQREGHFVALVSYLNKIEDPKVVPETYIVPSEKLEEFIYSAPGGRRVIQRSRIRKDGKAYRDAWHLVAPVDSSNNVRH